LNTVRIAKLNVKPRKIPGSRKDDILTWSDKDTHTWYYSIILLLHSASETTHAHTHARTKITSNIV